MGIKITISNKVTDAEYLQLANPLTMFGAEERSFKSGNKGYLANGIAVLDGKKYRCNLRLIEIVPKEKKVTPTKDSILGASIVIGGRTVDAAH